DFVADEIAENAGMAPTVAHPGGDGLPYLLLNRDIVEKRDVLRPGQTNENLQAHPVSCIEQPDRRHREDPHGIDAGPRHQREIAVDRRGFRELSSVVPGRERAVSHAFDEMLLISGEEK